MAFAQSKVSNTQLDKGKEGIEPMEVFEAHRQPAFPGGQAALLKFLAENLRWPTGCEEVTGIIVVSFVIDTTGNCRDWRILRSPSEKFASSVDEIFWKMPCWERGESGGHPVPIRYTLPIRVHLE